MNQSLSQNLMCQEHTKEVEYLCIQSCCPKQYSVYCNICKDQKIHNHGTFIYLADYLNQLTKIIQDINNLQNNGLQPTQNQNNCSKIYGLITNLEQKFSQMFQEMKDSLKKFQSQINIQERLQQAHQEYENEVRSHGSIYKLSSKIDNYLVQNKNDQTQQLSISIQPKTENLDSLQKYSLTRITNQLQYLLKTFENPLLKFSEFKVFQIVKPDPLIDGFNFNQDSAHEFTFEATSPVVMTGFYIPLAQNIKNQVLKVEIHSNSILRLNVDLRMARQQTPTLPNKMLVHFGDKGLQMVENQVISIVLKIDENTVFDNYQRANIGQQFKIQHAKESVNKSATRDLTFITDILYYKENI